MEGYIFKWVNFIKGWRPQYLLLEDTQIVLSKHKNEKKSKVYDIKSARVIDEQKNKKFLIEVGDKKIYIKTNTEDEKKAWITKIMENISNSRNKPRESFLTPIKSDLSSRVNGSSLHKRTQRTETLCTNKTNSVEITKEPNENFNQIDDYLQNMDINPDPIKNKRFSEAYKSCYREINKNKIFYKNKFENLINNFQNFQNLFFEFNYKLEDYNLYLMSEKLKLKEKEDLTKFYVSLFSIKQEMKEQFDKTFENLINFKEELVGNNHTTAFEVVNEGQEHNYRDETCEQDLNNSIIRPRGETFYCVKEEEEIVQEKNIHCNDIGINPDFANDIKSNLNFSVVNLNNSENQTISNTINIDKTENTPDQIQRDNFSESESESSFEDCLTIPDLEPLPLSFEKKMHDKSDRSQLKFSKSLSFIQSDFYDIHYLFEPRKVLSKELKCSTSMVKDMLTSLTKDKISMPINYNEPLSMLQKQCEKFQHSNLLFEASTENSNILKMCFIGGFLISELSLNINRILKPFNPILGETFEYFDNNMKYRFFSEQVSHHPPISAYICESEAFVCYGDSRCKNHFKFFKGAMEITFTNKTNVLFKNTNDHFVFNKPQIYLKGLIMGSPRYDFSGIVTIEDINDPKLKLILDFFEEGRKSKPLGYFEGRAVEIVNGKEKIFYLIHGNWTKGMWITDSLGGNKRQIFEIIENNNNSNLLTGTPSINLYPFPSYSCNLNNLPEGLLNVLPPTDSRFRPDQRELENGNFDKAEKEKNRLEDKQRLRHKKFEADKVKYEPNYFVEVLEKKTSEYIYIYKGDYWKDRKENNFNHLYNVFS